MARRSDVSRMLLQERDRVLKKRAALEREQAALREKVAKAEQLISTLEGMDADGDSAALLRELRQEIAGLRGKVDRAQAALESDDYEVKRGFVVEEMGEGAVLEMERSFCVVDGEHRIGWWRVDPDRSVLSPDAD